MPDIDFVVATNLFIVFGYEFDIPIVLGGPIVSADIEQHLAGVADRREFGTWIEPDRWRVMQVAGGASSDYRDPTRPILCHSLGATPQSRSSSNAET